MHSTSRGHRFRAALAAGAVLVPLVVAPAIATADPGTPSTPTAPATPTTPPPAAPSVPDTPTVPAPKTETPTTGSPAPTTSAGSATSTLPAPTTSQPPQGPPGRLTVGAVRIVDEQGATVGQATAFVQGCNGGPGATLTDGGSTTVVGQCVTARIDRVPTNWRLVSPSSQTKNTSTGRAEFRFVFSRGGVVPPPPPSGHRNVQFTLTARDQNGRGVPSQYSVSECDTARPLGGARTDSGGNGGGRFPGGCLTVVPTAWPEQCVLLGPNVYAHVVGNGVSALNFRFRCDSGAPPSENDVNGALHKTDRLTGAPLAGASFAISRCESGETVRAVTTGDGGLAALSLPPGCYKATETVAPAGYVRDGVVAFDVRRIRFAVEVTNVRLDAGPVVRNPLVRVPIASVPSGPTIGTSR